MAERLVRQRAFGGMGLGLRFDTCRVAGLCRAAFIDSVAREGLHHSRFGQFAAEDADRNKLVALGTVEHSYETALQVQLVIRFSDAGVLTYISEGHGSADVWVAASDPQSASSAFESLTEVFRPLDERPDQVPVIFWAGDRSGSVTSAHRRIGAPAWLELQSNHPAETREALDSLMAARSAGGGRLLLWHGLPGTGKTYALRALLREWREWCVPHFISDPELFLADASSYLMNVLTHSDSDPDTPREWQLVILEDSGELLAADARERTGQALSRLLNITDGLLGQGMNSLVLVTTNEPLGKLHPAVTRPGRCWAEVEFEPLGEGEANNWLRERGSEIRVTSPTPIADLYALLAGHEIGEEPEFGFAAA